MNNKKSSTIHFCNKHVTYIFTYCESTAEYNILKIFFCVYVTWMLYTYSIDYNGVKHFKWSMIDTSTKLKEPGIVHKR